MNSHLKHAINIRNGSYKIRFAEQSSIISLLISTPYHYLFIYLDFCLILVIQYKFIYKKSIFSPHTIGAYSPCFDGADMPYPILNTPNLKNNLCTYINKNTVSFERWCVNINAFLREKSGQWPACKRQSTV